MLTLHGAQFMIPSEVKVSASVPLSASSLQGDGDEYWKPPSVQVDECEDSPHRVHGHT